MKRVTGLLVAVGFLGLASCQRVENEFIIRDPKNMISAAELQLCGKHINLAEINGGFSVTMPITCEGGGNIEVRLINGSKSNCPTGYVTPSAEQKFEFVFENGHCGWVADAFTDPA